MMPKKKVRIPEPCHMTWNQMDKIENSKNRHCNMCAVDLVDFTSMTDEEMIDYLSTRKSEKVCVRMFAADALSDPSTSQVVLLSWYKKIRDSRINLHVKAALMLIFSSVLLTACGGGDDYLVPPCYTELVPDTTTVNPTDSVEVTICE